MLQSQFKSAYILSFIIAILALVQSAGGLFIGNLYRDNAWVISAWYGNDLVTLIVAVPLFVAALILSIRGSQRAQLVWLGMLAYMLYNYAFYLFGAALNNFFLIYVALFSLSIYALIFAVPKVDVGGTSRRFRTKTPVKWISGYIMLFAVVVCGMWVSQSLSFVASVQIPQIVVDTGHVTNLVAALDLSLQVPFLALGAIWLWKRQPWGYVLAATMMIADTVYMVVLLAFSPFAVKAGVPGAWDFAPLWAVLFVGCLVSSGFLLGNMQSVNSNNLNLSHDAS